MADMVEVTRCKDCENYNAEKDSFRCWIHCADVQENDFCSYAQPRIHQNDEVRE